MIADTQGLALSLVISPQSLMTLEIKFSLKKNCLKIWFCEAGRQRQRNGEEKIARPIIF